MARTSWLWVAAMAVTWVACSGGRQDDVSCDNLSPCPDDSVCIDGLCRNTGDVQIAASASSVGADIPVLAIDAAGNVCAAANCTNLPYGGQVTFRAGSAPGYRFTGWSGSAECVGTNPDLVIPNLQQTTHCDANYVRRVKVAAHTSGGEGGVSASSDSPFAVCNGGVCEVDEGAPVKLRADDRFGQRFTGWSGAGCGSATTFETTVTASADLLCVANFVERIVVSAAGMNAQVTIEVTSEGGVCEPGSCILDKGGNATITAPVVPKFRFAGWSGTRGCVGSDPVLRFSALQQSESCLASYTPRVTVSGSSSGATPPPAITALSADLYASCNGGACDTDVGGGVTLLAGSTAGYRLTGWSGPQCDGEKGAAVMLTNVSTDTQCVASYLQGIAVIGAVVGAPGEVSATSTTEAAVCAEGGCVIDIGGNATLTAPSPAGYRFLGWDGDEGCTSSAVTISLTAVTQSKTCNARFAARYLVRGTASPSEGGTVAASSTSTGAVCENDGCTLDGAGEVALTVTPRTGFRFSGWSGGGACTGTETTVRITNVQGNTTCQANFVGRFTVAGLPSPANGGSVVAVSDSAAAACTGATCQVDRGSRVSLTAAAAEGFRFVGWSGCSSSTAATLALEGIAQDMACTATFTPLRYTVSSSVAPADSGTVVAAATAGNPQCGGGQCTVDWGSAVSLTAAPATGWRFGGWTGCTTSEELTINLPNVRADASCQARFVRITFTVSAAFTPPNGGNVAISAPGPGATCTGLRCTVPYGGGASLVATPAQGWSFGGWSGCSTSMSGTLELANLTANADCNASFTRQRFDVAGTAAPAEAGAVSAASSAPGAVCNGNRCTVNYGSAVTLSAAPNTGYRFVSWTGCGTSTQAQLNVPNVTAAVSCQANFERLRFTVTGDPGAGGAVVATSNAGDCAGNACTVNYGGAVSLAAVPATGFRFVGWSGACTGADPVFAVGNVTANVTCAAAFQVLTFNVVGSGTPANGGTVTVGTSTAATCNGAVCVVRYGGSVTYAAAPAAGFNLTGWTGCSALANDPTRAIVNNVTAPASCVARFTLRSYRVAGTAAAGGSISAATTTSGACTGAVCTVNHGGNATFTAALEAGYTFGGWTGCTANPQNALQATVTNVTAAATCAASFTRQRFTVTGNSGAGGMVVAASNGGDCTLNSCTVNYGADVALMAAPATGFRFLGWSGGGVCTGAAPGLAIAGVTANVACTASFERLSFPVTGSVTPAAAGTMRVVSSTTATCTGLSCAVQYGGAVTFEVAETDAYEFVSWTGCTPLQEAPRRAVVSNVTAAGSCVATYRLRTYRVEGIADTGGTVGSATVNPGTCAGNVCTVGHGGAVSFTAAPQTGYVLNGWSGACTPSAQNPLLASWTGVTQPGTCTASFRRSLVTVTAVPSIRVGQVAASLGGVTCDGASCMNVPSGSSVQLSATIYPYSGRFTSWTCTDGTTSVAATINLVANAPLTTCTANFTSFVPVSATSNNTNAGTASVLLGSGGGTCVSTATCYVDLNSTVTLRATPSSAQYVFRGWAASSANVTCPVANPASATTTLLASASAGCLAQFGTLDIAPD